MVFYGDIIKCVGADSLRKKINTDLSPGLIATDFKMQFLSHASSNIKRGM